MNLCEVLTVNQMDENSVSGNDARSSSPVTSDCGDIYLALTGYLYIYFNYVLS